MGTKLESAKQAIIKYPIIKLTDYFIRGSTGNNGSLIFN
jgi:hypothetical protein